MAITFRDIRLNTTATLTGRVVTMDASNGRDDDDPNFALLPDGEALITLHIRLEDQPDPACALVLPGVVSQMSPAYAAWLQRNSPSVAQQLRDIVGDEHAATLLSQFNISPKGEPAAGGV